MSHPYYGPILTLIIIATVAVVLAAFYNWTAWRHAVEARRDARERRARRDAQRAQREREARP